MLPQERRMQFRMGVHVGEIIVEDEDIFGETVNIAARLQETAETGGISLSGTARDALRKTLMLSSLTWVTRPSRTFPIPCGTGVSTWVTAGRLSLMPPPPERLPNARLWPFYHSTICPETSIRSISPMVFPKTSLRPAGGLALPLRRAAVRRGRPRTLRAPRLRRNRRNGFGFARDIEAGGVLRDVGPREQAMHPDLTQV